MTTIDPIRILMSSDHHFGSPKIDQQEMAEAFAKTIFPLLPTTDIFFINGDFFDQLVIFDSHQIDPIIEVIIRLLYLCEQHQVTLRVLQGTWTHDRNQLKRFNTFYRHNKHTFDFHLAENIELEIITIRDRSIRILYVPDDLPYKSSDDIVDVIRSKMDEVGWDYVDYACMHGFFEFTFPKNISQTNRIVYRESQFSFVKKMINVGHVHQYRVSGKAISNGSFDRGVHGDQDPKGCTRVDDYPDHYTAHFIENKLAAVYDTIHVSKEDTTETIVTKVSEHLASLSTDRTISLRFLVESNEYMQAIKSWMKETHPKISIKVNLLSEVDDKPILNPSSVLLTPIEKEVSPTPKTISTFIRSHISESFPLTTERIEEHLTSPV